MKSGALSQQLIAGASVLAVAAGAVVMPSTPSVADSYMAGDFHNHTPCSDGRSSVETMVKKAVQSYGLEWLGAADHGGSSPRDCRIDDPEGDGSTTGTGKFWDVAPATPIKGDRRDLAGPSRDVALAERRGNHLSRSWRASPSSSTSRCSMPASRPTSPAMSTPAWR